MKLQTIKAIFTDILFIIGIILIIVGFGKGASTVAKLALFSQYPLPQFEERSCDYPAYREGEITPRETKDECLKYLEISRKVRLTEDIVNSLTLFSAGIIMVLLFRNFLLGDTHLVRLFPKIRASHHKSARLH